MGLPRGSSLDLDRLRRVQLALRSVPLAKPMTEYKLNSGFGYRRDPLNRRSAMHTGQDFGGPANAAVLATAPGEVIEAGRSGAYGIMVVIDHGMGLETRYAHLRKVLVRVGQKVALHDQVGVMGRTGRATGPTCTTRSASTADRSIPLRSSRPAASSCSSPAASRTSRCVRRLKPAWQPPHPGSATVGVASSG